jgi:hypothetical protein
MRPQRLEFTPDEIRQWYRIEAATGRLRDVDRARSSLDSTVQQVLRESRLTPAETDQLIE